MCPQLQLVVQTPLKTFHVNIFNHLHTVEAYSYGQRLQFIALLVQNYIVLYNVYDKSFIFILLILACLRRCIISPTSIVKAIVCDTTLFLRLVMSLEKPVVFEIYRVILLITLVARARVRERERDKEIFDNTMKWKCVTLLQC